MKYPGETGGIILLLSYSPDEAEYLRFLARQGKKCGLCPAARENEWMKKKKTKGRNPTEKPARKSVDMNRAYHAARLRESYSQAAEQSLQICKEWERLDYELWAKLDQHERP